jgi:hypothetical protein
VKRALFAALLLLLASGVMAGQAPPARGGQEARRPHAMSSEERLRLRRDVDSARGSYQRRELRRPEQRLGPEEREKLRRDVQDANRDIRRR